ncbi:MAG TPA: TolC family protein, partial [Cyclobacteriaceae bacterium]|nr:TolC family protein [Cyclobacteriaceae bacterium]
MRISIAFIFLLFFSIRATAQQTTEPVKVLTFEEAIGIALQNSVSLNQQRNFLSSNQALKTSSIAKMAPSVNAGASATEFNGNSFNQNTGLVTNGVRDNVNASINARVTLFSGLGNINGIRQYTSLLEAQSNMVNRTAQDVMNNVSVQYLTVMLDVELLKIAKENFEYLQKQMEQIKEMVALGSKSQVDEYNQDALTKGAELRFVQAEIALANDKALLAQTLLIDAFEQFDVEKPNWDINAIGNESLKLDELAEQAKLSRGDYLRAVKNEEAARFSMSIAKGGLLPTLSAFGGLGSSYNYQHDVSKTLTDPATGDIIDNPFYPRPFNEQFKTNNFYKQYGLNLNIPIFNGLQQRAFIVQQRAAYDNSTLIKKNLELQIKNDVLRAVRVYEGAKKAFVVTVDQLVSAEQAFNFETERFNLGVTNFVDYSNANKVFVQSQTDKAQAEYRLIFQKILLEYAVGTLKPEEF